MYKQEHHNSTAIPKQLKPVRSLAIQDNRPQAVIQKKQAEGMNVQRNAINTGTDAPIQLAKWKYQTIGGWQLISGNNTNHGHPFPPKPKDGDLFDDETGIQTRGTKTRQTVKPKTESTGMPLPNTGITNSDPLGHREVGLRQTQKMRGGPDQRYNSDHDVDSKFAIAVNTAGKTCAVTIRIQSSAGKSVFNNWASVTDAKWSNRFGLRVLSGNKKLSGFYMITVKLVQVQGHEQPHHVVVPQNSNANFSDIRGMKGTRSMTEWGTEDAVDVPHEVGHMLGNLDEYYTINDHEYTAPGETARGGVDVGGGSIMNDPKNNPLDRHYELIRKEAAAAIGVQQNEVTIEEAGHIAQTSNSSKKITRTNTMGGGIDLSVISSSRSNLKKVSSSSNVHSSSEEEEPITDFTGVLKRNTGNKINRPLPEKQIIEQPVTDFRSMLKPSSERKTFTRPVKTEQETPVKHEEEPKVRRTLPPPPEKITLKNEEPKTPVKHKEEPKVKRTLPPPPEKITLKNEEPKTPKIKPVTVQEQPPEKVEQDDTELKPDYTTQMITLNNGFSKCTSTLNAKKDSPERDELASKMARLKKHLVAKREELGDEVFFGEECMELIKGRIRNLFNGISELE